MKCKILLTLGLLVLSGCSQSAIRLRSDLIRSYSYAEQKKEPFEAPYVAEYKNGSKSLNYIAADHGSELEGPTFKTIKSIFASYKPDVVIIEGVEFTGEYSPVSFKKRALSCSSRGFKNCSESAYAAYLAIESKIPFIPSELQEDKIAQILGTNGYEEKEYWLLTAGQLILQFQRQEPDRLKDLDKNLKHDINVSLGEFERWYQKKSGKKFDIKEINSETFSPQLDTDPTYFNKIAAAQGMIREKFILDRIQDAIDHFDRVLIVFGAGHLVKEREVLNNALGRSKNLKLFP